MTATYSLTEQLAKHLLRPVDDATRARARLHLLDWLGCVAGAPGSALHTRLADAPPVAQRAFLGNLLEMDDVHRTAVLHPGPVVWPTVLDSGRPLDRLLDAAVRGYEAMIAIGATFDAHHCAHYHPTATAGVFGAVAAKASLQNLDGQATVAAPGMAGTVSGGLWQTRHEPGDAKQWHVAHAVMVGSHCGWHASLGADGPAVYPRRAAGPLRRHLPRAQADMLSRSVADPRGQFQTLGGVPPCPPGDRLRARIACGGQARRAIRRRRLSRIGDAAPAADGDVAAGQCAGDAGGGSARAAGYGVDFAAGCA